MPYRNGATRIPTLLALFFLALIPPPIASCFACRSSKVSNPHGVTLWNTGYVALPDIDRQWKKAYAARSINSSSHEPAQAHDESLRIRSESSPHHLLHHLDSFNQS